MSFAQEWGDSLGSLTKFAYKVSRNQEDAGDLIAETAFRACRAYKKFRGDCPFKNWILRIAAGVRIDMARTNSRHSLIDDAWDESSIITLTKRDQPEDIQRGLEVDEVLASMDPEQRELAILTAQGYTRAEIGDVFGRSTTAIKSREVRMRCRMTYQYGRIA